MNFTIACPACQRTLRVPESLLGQEVKCPSCEQQFAAPESVEEEAPVSASRRPATPPPEDDLHDDEPPRPSKRRPRDDDDYDDDAPRRSRREIKNGKVQAVGIMTLVGGILAILWTGGMAITIYGLCWPGTYYSLVMGILAIVKGAQLLGDRAADQAPPTGIAVMQIINVINCDFVNLTLGIINLVFLGDQEVKRFFRRG